MLLLLAGCTSQAEPSLSKQQSNAVAAANRTADATAQAQAQDASATKTAKQAGTSYQASDDHITSPAKAALAVKQVLKAPKQQLFAAVPAVNADGHGHHYYQVDAFAATTNGSRGQFLKSYFVYLNGQITTKQVN